MGKKKRACQRARCDTGRPSRRRTDSLRQRPLDLRGREAHPVALLQHLVGGDRLAIDADQVILRPAVREPARRRTFATVVPSAIST